MPRKTRKTAAAPIAPTVHAQVLDLPVAQIRAGEQVTNDRTVFDPEKLQQLADSISANGLAQPITVRQIGEGYEVVAGERRLRAVRDLLKWETIPAIVRTEMGDDSAAAMMLLENTARENLNPMDEARAYHSRLHNFGWDVHKIAQTAGVHPSTVERRLSLFNLSPDIMQLVETGNLPIGFAEEMPKLDANRQHAALRILQESEKMNLPTFRNVIKQLYSEQQQESLLDPEAFRLKQETMGAPTVTKLYSVPIYRITLVRDGTMQTATKQIRTSQDAADIVRQYLDGADREHFVVILLDQKNKVIGITTVSIGSLTASVVHPRDVYKAAILANAASIVCAHNHPSGNAAPSQEDRAITQRLRDSGTLLGISMLDHVIVGDGTTSYFSFADEGLLSAAA
jgi:DNA repair protein RadC